MQAITISLALLISQAGRAEREQKKREIGELSQDIKSFAHCFLDTSFTSLRNLVSAAQEAPEWLHMSPIFTAPGSHIVAIFPV